MVSCTLIIKLLNAVVPAKCLKEGVDVEPVRLLWGGGYVFGLCAVSDE